MPTAKLPYERARRYADKIAAALAPLCDRIEIAGSIRRKRPMCGDIDLVVLPQPGQAAAVRARCKQRVHAVNIDGAINLQVVLLNMVKLDVFIARPAIDDLYDPRPSNWGSLLLMRTGSQRFNAWFAARAQSMRTKWHPYDGIFRNSDCIAAATENDMFTALKLNYIPPEAREK